MVNPATRESVLWGVVAALAFLVLIQGYELLTPEGVALTAKAGVALVVAGVTAGSTYYTRRRLLAGTAD